jgi:hypothetical protein
MASSVCGETGIHQASESQAESFPLAIAPAVSPVLVKDFHHSMSSPSLKETGLFRQRGASHRQAIFSRKCYDCLHI